MADHHDHEHFKEFDDERVTSPMQSFSMGQVTTGLIVAAVGLVVTLGVPFLLLF